MPLDDESLGRIKSSVVWTETQQQGKGTSQTAGRAAPQALYYGILTEDVAAGESGEIAVYSSIDGGSEVRRMDIYNWGCDLKTGDQAIIAFVTGKWVPISAVRSL